jgi:hypothetical protein
MSLSSGKYLLGDKSTGGTYRLILTIRTPRLFHLLLRMSEAMVWVFATSLLIVGVRSQRGSMSFRNLLQRLDEHQSRLHVCLFRVQSGSGRLVVDHTEMTERTLKTCQILLRSTFQVAIASLSSFAW